MNLQQHLIRILTEIGTKECLEKAQNLQSNPSSSLNFRDLELSGEMVSNIAKCLAEESFPAIISVSFSYNQDLGDEGANALAAHLPIDLTELGMVDCGIQDKGGLALLKWAKAAPNLRMICIENNSFSADVQKAFSDFRRTKPNATVVF